jgi:hypothetical protein
MPRRPDASWRGSSGEANPPEEGALAAQAQPDAQRVGATPLWVGLLRLVLAAGAVATGSPWAVLIVVWILLAHVLLED